MEGIAETRRYLIVGVNGQFGQIFARKLAGEGDEVAGMDLQERPFDAGACPMYRQMALGVAAPAAAAGAVEWADCVLLCIPEEVIREVLPVVCRAMRRDALLVDIASVKTRIRDEFKGIEAQVGYLSIHPMFGPMEDFGGRTVCVVPLKASRRGERFLEKIASWRADIRVMSADEHDAVTALVQALPHAALIAFGAALATSPVPLDTVWAVATPIQRLMLALAARVATSGDHSTSWSIQSANPAASPARESLKAQMERVERVVAAQQSEGFTAILDSIRSYLGPELARLLALAKDAVGTTRS
jgi:4-amino-4-deoxyprephenate dehydrogenase